MFVCLLICLPEEHFVFRHVDSVSLRGGREEKCHSKSGVNISASKANNMEWKLAIQISNFARQLAQHYDDSTKDNTMGIRRKSFGLIRFFSSALELTRFFRSCRVHSGLDCPLCRKSSQLAAYTRAVSVRLSFKPKMRFSLLINKSFRDEHSRPRRKTCRRWVKATMNVWKFSFFIRSEPAVCGTSDIVKFAWNISETLRSWKSNSTCLLSVVSAKKHKIYNNNETPCTCNSSSSNKNMYKVGCFVFTI